MLPTLVITIPNLEIFLFCQHNSTGGENLELRQTIVTYGYTVGESFCEFCNCASIEKWSLKQNNRIA
jgi:hypothetical protein